MYLAAGEVYGLEGELGDLEECARSIQSGTSDTELSFLEDQVASAAAQVQHSEIQVLERRGPAVWFGPYMPQITDSSTQYSLFKRKIRIMLYLIVLLRRETIGLDIVLHALVHSESLGNYSSITSLLSD